MKILEEYMPYTSLSSVVKKIPDECSVKANDLGLNSKAAIFLQKACLSAMSKISKQNLTVDQNDVIFLHMFDSRWTAGNISDHDLEAYLRCANENFQNEFKNTC